MRDTALRLAERIEAREYGCYLNDVVAELRRLHALNAELVEALRSTGLFLHHVWCDVQMNDYSFEKLNQQMQVVDAALAKVQGESK